MKIHELKTIQPYFDRVWIGDKTFEIRKNDRDFQAGDKVILKEYDSVSKTYTKKEIIGYITYVLYNYEALENGYCIFSFKIDDWIDNRDILRK